MKKYIYITMAVLAIAAQSVVAQYRVSGFVLDAEKNPLPGATVRVAGVEKSGVVADVNGEYSLTLPDNVAHTLVFSFIGYKNAKIEVSPEKRTGIDAVLVHDNRSLDMVVVTGTRTPKLLKEAPIVTRVISSDDIKRADATHIGDLLQSELPGVEFSYSMNQQTALDMSGFGGNSVLFLVDGERIAGETLDNVDYTRLGLDNVERVEIVKGAASSLYGSNAVGGVVNIISGEAVKPWSLNVNARHGAHGEQRYGASLGLKGKLLNSVTNFQYTTIDAIDLSKGTDNSDVGDYSTVYAYTTYNIKERLRFNISDKLKLTARAGYFFREREPSNNYKERYRSVSGGLKGNYDISEKGKLEIAYLFDQYDKSDYVVSSERDIRDYSNVQHSMRALYNHAFAGNNILTVGGDFMRDYLMSYQFADGGSHTQRSADAFAQFDYNPTKRINLIAGARFDYFSSADIYRLSPKLNFMYKLGNASIRAGYSAGFRAPTLKERYMNFDMASIFMIYGNEELKAEHSHNLSLSGEVSRGDYNATLTGFCNFVNNRITTAWNQTLSGQKYMNMERVRVNGIDANISAKYDFGIEWRASYAYTKEHVKKGSPQLSSTRPHTATAYVAYHFDRRNYELNISLTGRYLSKVTADEYKSLTSYDETEKKTYPGYSIWKLGITQRFCRGISVVFAVDNLFDYTPDYYYSNSPATTGIACSLGVSLDIDEWFKKK